MEFESMDNCFLTAQGGSATTSNAHSSRGTMAPTKSNRERCGSSPRSTVTASTAAIAWNGHLAAIPFSLVAPLLVYHTKSRKHAYASMFSYYAAASWPLIPGARAFFGAQGTPLIGLLLCLAGGALLALPWGLL